MSTQTWRGSNVDSQLIFPDLDNVHMNIQVEVLRPNQDNNEVGNPATDKDQIEVVQGEQEQGMNHLVIISFADVT